MSIKHCEITELPIQIQTLESSVKNHAHGAVVSFCGNVRDNDSEKIVSTLNYEIHPSAQAVLNQIATEIQANNPAADIAVAHRYGDIPIGETAFAVAVSTHHRAEAFEICRQLVDTSKEKLPIWKHQVFDDGSSQWVNSP